MALNMCRFCLNTDNLRPIFENFELSDGYSSVLEQITGLKIEPNDVFPQQICIECSNFINQSIIFRNSCQITETKLKNMIFQESTAENMISTGDKTEKIITKNDFLEDLSADCYDFDGFKIEVELDRLTEDNGGKKDEAKDARVKPTRKNQRKVKRELYLSMVDGDLIPNEPVKCKVCKKTVSKWTCFINHAKKHLGFNFICEFCGKSFISSNQLKRHCRSYHGLERELKCKHCSYLALDNAQLLVHERRMHTGDRPYVCDVCAAAYFSRKCLVQHIECHRTTASVQCDQCPALFKSKRHLAKHRYGAHTDKRRARRRERRNEEKGQDKQS